MVFTAQRNSLAVEISRITQRALYYSSDTHDLPPGGGFETYVQ